MLYHANKDTHLPAINKAYTSIIQAFNSFFTNTHLCIKISFVK